MPVIDVVLNRNAHRLTPGSALHRALVRAAARGGARVQETRTLAELEDAARRIADRKTDGVVLAGGDGSHMAGVTALWRAHGGTLPPVAFAPGGTVCTIARNFGMRGPPCGWAERVVAAACSGTARLEERPTLLARDDRGGDRVGFLFGAGLVARFFEVYYAAPRPGLARAARIAARVFAGSFVGAPLARRILERTPCRIWIDGAPHPAQRWTLVLASVVRDAGLHLHVTYLGGLEPGRFHVVANGLAARALAQQMPRVLAGRPLRGEPRVDTLARSLRIVFDGTPRAYVLDGDVFAAGQASVDPGPVLPLLVV